MSDSIRTTSTQAAQPSGRAYTSASAIALCEYHLILTDLQVALRNLEIILQRYPGIQSTDFDENEPATQEAITIAEALFRDAIIQWVGVFGDEKRGRLSVEAIYGGSDDALASFAYAQDLRDTYAAHNFGPQRQAHVSVILADDGSSFKMRRFRYAFSLPSADQLPGYLPMITTAIEHVEAIVAGLEARVREELIELGPDGARALPPLTLRVPSPNELRMSRREFREGRSSGRRGRRGKRGQRPQAAN